MKCPNCGNVTQNDAVFCDQCGTRLSQEAATPVAAPSAAAPVPSPAPVAPVVAPVSVPVPPVAPAPVAAPEASTGVACPGCGSSNTPGEMFCSECGAPLAEPEPEAEATVIAPAAETEPAPAALPFAQSGVCSVCGANLVPGDAFCHACGAESGAEQPAPAVAAPIAPVAVAPEPVAPVVAEPVAVAPAAEITECPTCGATVTPGDTFCEFCGAVLATPVAPASGPVTPAAPATTTPAAPVAPVAPAVTAIARFVLPGSGLEIALPQTAEVIVGREDPFSNSFPEIDLTPHGGEEGGVSRRHFKVSRVAGGFTIEDLNSTNLTLVNRQRLAPGIPIALKEGDEVLAGRVKLIFKVS